MGCPASGKISPLVLERRTVNAISAGGRDKLGPPPPDGPSRGRLPVRGGKIKVHLHQVGHHFVNPVRGSLRA
jgi:hypothetical protein